jgi:hypothetical protein
MLYSEMINFCSEIHISTKIQSADGRNFLILHLEVHKFTIGLERVKYNCRKYVNKLKIKFYN